MMLARTILIGFLTLGGTVHAACPSGPDLTEGIVLQSNRDGTYHHRALDLEGTLVWQATGVYGDPPSQRDASLWLYDHGLLEIHLERSPRGHEISRRNVFEAGIADFLPLDVGQRFQIRGERVQSDGGYRASRLDTFEVLDSTQTTIGDCSYQAVVVRHFYKEATPDGEVRETRRRKLWIPELRLIAAGSGYGNGNGYASIRKRGPDDWFEEN